MMRWKKQRRTRYDNEDTDANRRDIDCHVFCEFAAVARTIDSDRRIPTPSTDLSLASRGRRLEFPCRSGETTGFLGPYQIHPSAIRPEWLVPIHGRRSSRDLGAD